MTLAAKLNNWEENETPPSEIVSMSRCDQKSGEIQWKMRTAIQQYTELATDLAKESRDIARRAYEQTKHQTLRSYSRLVDRAQDLSSRTQAGMRQAKNQHPLQLLAVIAGGAFVFGVAIRSWRSRTS